MNMRQLLSNLQRMQQGGANAPTFDAPIPDTAETVYISSLALLKMLKHGALFFKAFKKIIVYLSM
jgi:hypothetical protein